MKEKEQTLEKYRRYLDGRVDHLSFELLSIYINFYTDLSQKEQQFFEQHLSRCPDCREKLNDVFDTELEIEKKTSLHLVEETKESQLGEVDQLFKFDSNLDPSTQVQQIHSLDRSIAIDIQMKSDQIRLIIQKFPDEYQQRALKITLPEVQVSTRIISFNPGMEIELPIQTTDNISQITEILWEFGPPIPESADTSSWLGKFSFGDIPPSRLAAAAVVLIFITAAYFIFYPDRPGPDKPLISQQIGTEAYQQNPLLENFVDRTLRSEQPIALLEPETADTVEIPIHFQWQAKAGKANYKLTILNNKNREIWQRSTTESELVCKDEIGPGLYYWKLQSDEGSILVGKFFVI